MAAIENSITNENADEEIARLDAEVVSMRAKLATFQRGGTQGAQVDLASLAALYHEFKSMLKHVRDRKRAVLTLCDAALEDSKKTPRQFLSEQGCETDEDANFKLDELQAFFDASIRPKLEKMPVTMGKKKM